MEPRKMETTPESTSGDRAKQPRPPERKRRFQIVKLEERIAPSNPHYTKGGVYTCRATGCNCFP
jgi:hypothetical protein